MMVPRPEEEPKNPEERKVQMLPKEKFMTPHEAHEVETALKDYQMNQSAMKILASKICGIATENKND